jgi:peptidoglycan/LPS O-acetylase OafA/YrhL
VIFILHSYLATRGRAWLNVLPTNDFLEFIIKWGNAGVDIFFIISGYLAVNSAIKSDTLAQYLLKRLIRLYPVYFAFLICTYLIGRIYLHNYLSTLSFYDYGLSFFYNLLLLPGLFNLPYAQWMAWALGELFILYLLWGTTSRLYTKIHKSTYYSLMFIALLIGFTSYVYYHPRAIFFIVGIMAYFTASSIKIDKKNNRLLTMMSILSFIVMASLVSYSVTVYKIVHEYPIYIASMFGYIFILSTIMNEGIINKLLTSYFMVFMGKISYSFFFIHSVVLLLVGYLFRWVTYTHAHQYVSLSLYFVSSFLISILLSWISYIIIEVEFTDRYLKRS